MTRESTIAQATLADQERSQVGAIDMGSRNFKSVFGQKINGIITTELVGKERLDIGKEVTENNGLIGRSKFMQIEEALSRFMRYCSDRGASKVLAIATSAIRNARNQQQVIDLAREIGLTMEVADGRREGEVGYLAATGGAPDKLVCDSGSKSIQIAWEINGKILSQSIPVGYELVYESFVEHASSLDESRKNFARFLDGNFKELPQNTDQFIALAANTITSFVTGEKRTGHQGRTLTRTALNDKMSELRELSPSQYNNLKSSLTRVEKTLPGLIFLDYLMERTGHGEALITESELPVGLIVEYFFKRGDGGLFSCQRAPGVVDTGAVSDHQITPAGMRQAAETINDSIPEIARQFGTLADHLESVIGYLQSIGEIVVTGPRQQFAIAAQKEGRKIWNIPGGKQRLQWVLHRAEGLEFTEVEILSMLIHCGIHESQSSELRAINQQIMLFKWQELAGRNPKRARDEIETITDDEECESAMREYLQLVAEQKSNAGGIFRLYNYINRYRNPGRSEQEEKWSVLYPFSYFLSHEERDHYQSEAYPEIHFKFSANMYTATDSKGKTLNRIQQALIGKLPVYFAITPPEEVVLTADAGLTREKLAAFSEDSGTLYIHWAGFDRL
jgi:exopolyphosphatase/pppGpp-phosphohydrolase